MTGKALVKLLQQNGWVLDRVSGSHHKLVKGGRHIVVPVHAGKDLARGLELAILKKAGLR